MTPRDNTYLDIEVLTAIAADQPWRLLFATVSGAHLYGFPSRNSDVDLRGVHLLPPEQLLGLRSGPETLTRSWTQAETEIDLVTHDAGKFFRLLLRRNGYVLEQVLSPLRVVTNAGHDELCAIAGRCATSNHAHHYRGFADSQWELFARTGELKPLLYTFRVLFTGIWLMRTGEIVAHLPSLLEELKGPAYVGDLVAAKRDDEHASAAAVAPPRDVLSSDVDALKRRLDEAAATSHLPVSPAPEAEAALHDLLLRLRLPHDERGS